MAIKKFKPTTNGQRHRQIINKSKLFKGPSFKPLSYGLVKKSGRNSFGRITTGHRGGGHKRKYRLIDFKRQNFDIPATVKQIEYDPNRSSFIALIEYSNGGVSYILAPDNLKVGDTIKSSYKLDIGSMNLPVSQVGTTLPLLLIPKGSLVHNIELIPGQGGKLIRAAGTYGKVIEKYKNGYAAIELKSGAIRLIPLQCLATLGTVSNKEHLNTVHGKAGVNRWLNRRPHVRGVAMNPIDHPHGGGEGKSKGGRPSVSKWGHLTKGKKTRRRKNTNKYIINIK